MNIGIFTDTYLPDINGVVSSVELLRKKLEEAGHNAYVICTYNGVYKVKKEGKIIRLPGVEVKKLYGYALAQPIHLLFIEELKELNLDLIHAETEFGVGIFANIVASTLNLPLVRTYHTTYEDYTHYVNFLKSKTLDKGLKKLVASWSNLYCNNCVKLITPSRKTMEMLVSYGTTTPIDIIPTGVELDRFKDNDVNLEKAKEIRDSLVKEGEKLLIFVGRVAKEKSIDMIIKAFNKVKEEGLKVKLLVVGDGPSLQDLKDLTSSLDLNDYISFVGKKPFEQVPMYYKTADAFISASTSETQGMTYIEALASGLIVLAHFDEVLTDIVKDGSNGYFFENENDIYNCIVKFDKLDKATLSKMKEDSIKSVEIYDADTFGKKSIDIYKEAIEDYKYSYTISKTTLKDDCVTLTLKSSDGSEEKLTINLDEYYNLGLRNASLISKLNYSILKELEVYALAYKYSLRKLANRDYSIKEMKDALKRKFELNDRQLELIIDKLIERGLLDDYRYALAKANSLKANLYSKKGMINKLRKLGIEDELIEKCVIDDKDTELLNARKLANKYMHTIRNKSLNAKKQAILTKLLNEGFSLDTAREALSVLDFSNSILEEKDILQKEANKALKKYAKKYTGTDLRNKIYMYLASKGFSYDNIYALINEMEL